MARVVVIGAGLGGLPTAYELRHALPREHQITRHEWGNVHFVMSVIALGITAIHLVIDWRALRGALHYLISVHRHPNLLE